MKTSILIYVILGLIVSGCGTTTHFNLRATYPEYIEEQIIKAEKDTSVGVEISLLLNNGSRYNGELLSVRDSTITLCTEYSAKEKELANLKYPVLHFSNDEMKELIIEGSNWVWEGIAAGTAVGIAAVVALAGIGAYDETTTSTPIAMPLILGIAAGWGIGYALSTEEYVLQEIPPDYNWSILKPLARYPDEEPEYLRAIE